jgi:alanyl-tRNA synthetase
VLDVQKHAGDLYAHRIEITAGTLEIGARGPSCASTPTKRLTTRANHSAAHLLHAALKNVLGAAVAQKGQMVDADRMRFDFSHNAPVTEDELAAMENEVNAVIRQNIPAETKLMTPQDAIDAGAVALFGEKYGDEVRVLTLGRSLTDDKPPIRSSCAAAPTWPAPATSPCSRSCPRPASPPACAASRP